jgi:nucleotide sugar dehydrogenase
VKVAITLPTALHLKIEDIDTPDKCAKYTVSILGCGLNGVFYAIAFAEAGYKVICIDADQSTVKKLSKGIVPLAGREVETKLKSLIKKEKITSTSETKNAITKSDIILITANSKGDQRDTKYSEITSYCKQIGASLQKESLVICCEIVGLGLIKSIVKETLENTSGLKIGESFGLAYNPFQDMLTQKTKVGTKNTVVAALDKVSLNSVITIFSSLNIKDIKATMNIEATELAALFQAAKREVNYALVNELAILCENAGVDYLETTKLVPENCDPNFVKPTILQEYNRSVLNLLEESAENVDVKLKLPSIARQINSDMIKHAVNLTQNALKKCEKTLRRAKIAVIGATISGSSNLKLIEILEAKGAKINHYNPLNSETTSIDTERITKKTIGETVEGTDCIVILTEQEQLKRLNLKKLKAIMKTPAAIIDLTGTVEPNKAQEEGFIYIGLGRGSGKK